MKKIGVLFVVIGEGEEEDVPVVDEFGLGSRNRRGDKVTPFYQRNKFCITNMISTHLTTKSKIWRVPGDINRTRLIS